MRKYLLFILTILCAATITATAQNNVTVQWNCSSKTLPNGNVELLFDATIPDGFRLYSPYNPEGASKPLLIIFDNKDNFTTDGKIIELQKPEEHYEEIFEVTEKFFKKNAKFKIVIKPTVNEPFTVDGKFDGQVCNDQFFCAMVRDEFHINVTPQKPKSKDTEKKKRNNSR